MRQRSGFGFAQMRFDLGEGLLDRVQIGRIGGQEQKPGTSLLEAICCLFTLMNREIVENDHITLRQRRGELRLDVGVERRPGDRAIDDPGGAQLMTAQRGQEGVRLPVAEGSACA